jgi:indolepyruvate ferredoxin oxidoreductase
MNAPLPEHIRKALETVTLDDKYSLDVGRLHERVQALVKLPMLQRQRDACGAATPPVSSAATAVRPGRPRPGAVESQEVPAGAEHRAPAGLNEELAATALWGTQHRGSLARQQQVRRRSVLVRRPRRGPRLFDVFKHANMAGTTPRGG